MNTKKMNNLLTYLLTTLFLSSLLFEFSAHAGNGNEGACGGTSLNFKSLEAIEQGKTPEQYVEELRARANEKIASLNCSGGPCSYFAEYAMRENLGDERAITLLPENPAEGRDLFEITASLHSDGYTLELAGIRVDQSITESVEDYYNTERNRILSLAPNYDIFFKDNFINVGKAMNEMQTGEVMFFTSLYLQENSGHAVNILRAQGNFLFFDEQGLILKINESGSEALFRFSQIKKINLLDLMNYIRIVE